MVNCGFCSAYRAYYQLTAPFSGHCEKTPKNYAPRACCGTGVSLRQFQSVQVCSKQGIFKSLCAAKHSADVTAKRKERQHERRRLQESCRSKHIVRFEPRCNT